MALTVLVPNLMVGAEEKQLEGEEAVDLTALVANLMVRAEGKQQGGQEAVDLSALMADLTVRMEGKQRMGEEAVDLTALVVPVDLMDLTAADLTVLLATDLITMVKVAEADHTVEEEEKVCNICVYIYCARARMIVSF